MKDRIEKAEILLEALPYLRRFFGKTIVIKYGGNAMVDDELRKSVARDVVLLRFVGMRPVLVHGGGPEISDVMKRLGKEPTFVKGLRVTDAETMEIVEMVLMGKTNKGIVSLINQHGGKAVGLSGKDANLFVAEKAEGDVDLGFVGKVTKINPEILNALMAEGYIPVISSVAIGAEGESYNINADHIAGELAAAMGAAKIVLLTDVRGIYDDINDENTLRSTLTVQEAQKMVCEGIVSSGMIPKVEAAITAIQGGVEKAHIIDGTLKCSLLMEIFTDTGIGTMITG